MEIKEHSLASAKDTEVMTDEMEIQAKKDILALASNFKSPSLQMDSIKTTRLAKRALFEHSMGKRNLGEGHGAQGSGLDLVFRKLDELEKKIHGEQDTDD